MASWLDRLFGHSRTRSHYEREAEKAAHQFVDHYPDEHPDFVDEAGGLESEEDPHGFDGADNIEFFHMEGKSEDVEWMSFNHSNGECLVQFLEHGKPGRLYRYKGLSRQDFIDMDDGAGPFPSGRDPHYLKDASTGQNVNYWLRNDQRDNGVHGASESRFTYERIG